MIAQRKICDHCLAIGIPQSNSKGYKLLCIKNSKTPSQKLSSRIITKHARSCPWKSVWWGVKSQDSSIKDPTQPPPPPFLSSTWGSFSLLYKAASSLTLWSSQTLKRIVNFFAFLYLYTCFLCSFLAVEIAIWPQLRWNSTSSNQVLMHAYWRYDNNRRIN